jgi:hypothetical protein
LADAEAKAIRALYAQAREHGIDSEAALKAFLHIPNEKGSLTALANHMCLPREKCADAACDRPHGLQNRVAAYTVMRQWIVNAHKAEAESEPESAPLPDGGE